MMFEPKSKDLKNLIDYRGL